MGREHWRALEDEHLVHVVQTVGLIALVLLTGMLCWLALTAV